MFENHMFFTYHLSNEEIAQQKRRYAELKAAFEWEIKEENTKLFNWLNDQENRKKTYYGLAQDIYNHFHRKTKNNEDRWLDYYRNMRDDLLAVNGALDGKGTNTLLERADAAMESNSPGLVVTGILLGAFAVTLICAGLFLLGPMAVYFGVIAAAAAFFTYEVGSMKVSTEQSTLFNRLSDKISPAMQSASRTDYHITVFQDADMPGLYFPRMW